MKLKNPSIKNWILIIVAWALLYFFFAAVYRVYTEPTKQELERFNQQRRTIGQP